MLTIAKALAMYTQQLAGVTETPRLDVELFLAEAMQLSRAQLMAYPEKTLTEQEQQQFLQWIARRLQREPLAYIVGHQPFWTLDLQVTNATLIPRPQTEHLIEWILANFSASSTLKVADLGVGSGAIALALAKERPRWRIDATDESDAALAVARHNAKQHDLTQVNFFKGDWCRALPKGKYDVIVSNPPYIAKQDPHLENLSFEPQTALIADDDGLQALKTIIEQSKHYLANGAYLVLEHGATQQKEVQQLLQAAGFSTIVVHADFSGQPRFVTAKFITQEKVGVLLLNLGTPSSPDKKAVRAYLKEFLADPLVIDLPWLLRMCLLYGLILPFRPKRSSYAYQQIWTQQGSPLLVYSEQFTAAVNAVLPPNYQAVLAMRYGTPSIANAVRELHEKKCNRIIVFPLFPQYSLAATGSAILAAERELATYGDAFQVSVRRSFYQDPHYYRALASLVKKESQNFNPDRILFSYHGLPERQLTKAGCLPEQCDRVTTCLTQKANLEVCYRAQCFATSRYIAEALQLPETQYHTVFQSRVGRATWIRPYVAELLPQLIAQGVKRLLVVCPSFVVDCLETLEEINIRLQQQWLSLGGEAFHMAPCLNTQPTWVSGFVAMVTAQRIFKMNLIS